MYQNTYKFKVMLIYQTHNYTLLQIKKKKTSLINSSPHWIKHELYTHTHKWKQTNKFIKVFCNLLEALHKLFYLIILN